jgi:hypothetical protein
MARAPRIEFGGAMYHVMIRSMLTTRKTRKLLTHVQKLQLNLIIQ